MDLRVFDSKPRESENQVAILPVHSTMNTRALSALELAALLLPAGVTVFERGMAWIWVLLAAILTALVWQRIFSDVRGRHFNPDGLVAAVVCAVALPASVSLWQVVLSLSFGIVVGQEIFGGRGRNFLNPATVALAFFIFSFPAQPLGSLAPAMALAVIPGALLLLVAGLVSWRVVAGAASALLLMSTAINSGVPPALMVPAGFLFGLIFLAADPVAAASTQLGRWVYGALFGGVTALQAGVGAPRMETVVSVALLAGIFAPLIDCAVIALNSYRRGQRHD